MEEIGMNCFECDSKSKIEWCNDCKRESVFAINKDQDPYYVDGKRLKECIGCGRYESEVE